jgi:hypothetical protein
MRTNVCLLGIVQVREESEAYTWHLVGILALRILRQQDVLRALTLGTAALILKVPYKRSLRKELIPPV